MKLTAALFCCLVMAISTTSLSLQAQTTTIMPSSGLQDRDYWINTLYKIVNPVVKNMAAGTLKKNLPLEKGPGYSLNVTKVTYMEAVGRTMVGIAPWLALPSARCRESN
jgi:hypothetical protein